MKPDSRPRRPHTTPPREGQLDESREVNVAAIRGVFRDLGLDDPEVRNRMKRLEEGWSTEEPTEEPQLMIRGDTADSSTTCPGRES